MAEHWMIAGANRGIGLELARRAAARGETLTVSVRNEEARAALSAKLAQQHAAPRILAFDVRDSSAIAIAAARAAEPIDVLIANAGIAGPQRQSPLDFDFDGALDLFSVDTLGPLRVAQAFLPQLRRGRNPRLVFISSIMGSMAFEGASMIGYRAAKAALNKLMQGLAEAVKPEGVTVVALHPGWVRTDMGGREAPLSVEESASGIIDTVDALTLADAGRFLDWQGETVAW